MNFLDDLWVQSGLALQLNWPDVLKDLTGRLMRAGSVDQQKQAARVLLEFMKVENIRADPLVLVLFTGGGGGVRTRC